MESVKISRCLDCRKSFGRVFVKGKCPFCDSENVGEAKSMSRLEQIKLSIKHGTLRFEDMDWLVQQAEILHEQNKDEVEDLMAHGK